MLDFQNHWHVYGLGYTLHTLRTATSQEHEAVFAQTAVDVVLLTFTLQINK